ncbi:MAG: HSP20 family protein [Rhodothermales bacterium]|jgi:HSP20 family protein
MTKIRFSPAVDSRHFQNEFERLFDGFFPPANRAPGTAAWAPRTDFAELPDSFEILMDAPGLTKDDFNIDFSDGALTISGERVIKERGESDVALRSERRFGKFTRTFALPRTVNEEKISAAYLDGVLTVYVPKSEDLKPRRIKIS